MLSKKDAKVLSTQGVLSFGTLTNFVFNRQSLLEVLLHYSVQYLLQKGFTYAR
jgi:hypothetical protein